MHPHNLLDTEDQKMTEKIYDGSFHQDDLESFKNIRQLRGR